jgi:hypothetical protein
MPASAGSENFSGCGSSKRYAVGDSMQVDDFLFCNQDTTTAIDDQTLNMRTPHHTTDYMAHNKRRLDDENSMIGSKDRDEEITSNLARSLKRVRVSCAVSPGELCLQRDLKYLVDGAGWRRTRDGSFSFSNCLLRQGICPSELILLVQDVGAKVHLIIPKAFPHRPPKIMPVCYTPVASFNTSSTRQALLHNRVETILITDELQRGIWERSNSTQATSTVVLANWTPIRRLCDCLVDIIRVLRSPLPGNVPSPIPLRTPQDDTVGWSLNTGVSELCASSSIPEGDRATEPRHQLAATSTSLWQVAQLGP